MKEFLEEKIGILEPFLKRHSHNSEFAEGNEEYENVNKEKERRRCER